MVQDFTLPRNWAQQSLKDLVGENGLFVDGDWVESKDQDPKGDVRLIQLADVGDGYYRNRSNRFLTSEKSTELDCTFLQEGDLLVARMPDPLGRACIFPGDAKKSVTVVDVCIIRTSKVNHHWLMYAINSPQFRALINSLQSGSTRKRISRTNLAKIELPVPPLPEQERIVAKIEELFTQLEAGTAALRRVQAGLKRYQSSVLKAACEGRLFGDVELTNDDLPVGWHRIQVNEAGKVQLGRQRAPQHHQGIHMRPYLRVANVYEDRIDLSDVKEMNFTPDEYEIYKLVYGDILLNEGQSPEFLGRPAMYKGELLGGCFQNTLIRFQAFDFVDPHFALIVFRHYMRSGRFAKESQITTNIAHLGSGRFGRIEFPLPPLIEQQRIVAEVERRISVGAQIDLTIEEELTHGTRLRQAILKRAFEGKLTDPNSDKQISDIHLEPDRGDEVRKDDLSYNQARLF